MTSPVRFGGWFSIPLAPPLANAKGDAENTALSLMLQDLQAILNTESPGLRADQVCFVLQHGDTCEVVAEDKYDDFIADNLQFALKPNRWLLKSTGKPGNFDLIKQPSKAPIDRPTRNLIWSLLQAAIPPAFSLPTDGFRNRLKTLITTAQVGLPTLTPAERLDLNRPWPCR